MDPKYYGNHRFVATRLMHVSLVYSNPTYQAFITPKPDCHPFMMFPSCSIISSWVPMAPLFVRKGFLAHHKTFPNK